MDFVTRQFVSNRRNRPARRARANHLYRLSAAAEPLEPRLLLTSVVVNTTADVTHAAGSTVVSLRDAINIANKSTSPTAITFSPTVFATAKTINLGKDLELSGKQPITITGPAAGVTVVGENVEDFVIDNSVTSTISGLTVTGGGDSYGYNGGIENYGVLTLKGVSVSGNGGSNAAICNAGTLTITGSIVSNNVNFDQFGVDAGGGIENASGAVLTLTNDTVSDNLSSNAGGIDNHGTATLTGCTISGNQAIGAHPGPGYLFPGNDGGIANYGKMTVTNCTIAGNYAGGTGGGIGNHGALTLTDSTVSGNTADGAETIQPYGVPFVPAGLGGGLYVDHSSSSTVIQNTIIAGNGADSNDAAIDSIGPDVFGTIHSNGHNLIGKTNGSSGWKTDLTGTVAKPLNALLSPLGLFGGATQTLVPLAGSPAIDHGSNALIPAGITTDQRGLPRIANHTVDIGAVEVQPSNAHIVVTARANLTATEGLAYSFSPASFADTGGTGPFLVEVNWGDGTAESLYSLTSQGALPRTSHIFAEEGTYHGMVTIFDATGHVSAPTPFTVKVADAPLHGTASPRSGVAAGVPFAWQAATFSDADPHSTPADFTATINWGDGTTSSGTVAYLNADSGAGPYGVTGTHTYAKAGTYTFVVTVKDAGGATLTVSSTVTCASAKAIVVNTAKDQTDPAASATVSLRDAIAMADKSTVPTAITFDPKVFATAKTITLTGSFLELSSLTTISIVGPSAGVTISGNNTTSVFDVDHGVSASFVGLTIANGTSASDGAGIYNQGVSFLTNCSVVNNSCTSGNGGGIANIAGFMVLTGDTISGNHAVSEDDGNGGGIENDGTMTLIDCTVANNAANSDNGNGGGIGNGDESYSHATIGILTVLDSTISDNTAQEGGGISSGYSPEYNSQTAAGNTIIAGNSAPFGLGPDASGNFTSLGFNLVGQTDDSYGWVSTDLTGTSAKPLNAKLGKLASNGGPTQTLLPQSGSPAINHGSNALVPSGVTTDQRGLPRIAGGTVDIGAVEVQS